MPKNNPYYIPKENYKKVEEVRFWDYKEVKKSPLSVAARSKVANKNGGNYLSENKEGYGPCEGYDCPYSSRFYLKIGFSDGFIIHEKLSNICCTPFNWTTMKDIDVARNVLRKFENKDEVGGYEVKKLGTFLAPGNWEITNRSQQKQAEIMTRIQNFIEYHERGGRVYETRLDLSDNGGCSNVIM